MARRRIAIGLDDDLVRRALAASGGTLNTTIEEGLRLVIERAEREDGRATERLERRAAPPPDPMDLDVVLS